MYYGRFASMNLTVTMEMKEDLIVNGYDPNKFKVIIQIKYTLELFCILIFHLRFFNLLILM